MTRTKNGRFDGSLKFSKEEKEKIKELVAYCTFGRFSTDYALQFINSGILGHHQMADKDGQSHPIAISESTYKRIKHEIVSQTQTKQDLLHFVKFEASLIIRQILCVFSQLQAASLTNLANEKDPIKNQQIINSIFKNMPIYTQYLSMIKKGMNYGAIAFEKEDDLFDVQ